MTIKKTKAPKRIRKLMHFSISPEARERLEDIAERSGQTMSAVVERLVREADMPRKLSA